MADNSDYSKMNVQTVIDYSSYIADHTKEFTGREWVFKAIDKWLDTETQRIFLLTGGPGSGKTAIASKLVQLCQEDTQSLNNSYYCPNLLRDGLAFYHFCQVFNDPVLNPLRFVEALSKQLANRYQVFAESLLNVGRQEIKINAVQKVSKASDGSQIKNVVIESLTIGNLSARVAFDVLMRRPLELLCAEDFKDNIIIMVDSLDEALTYNPDENILTLLQDATDHPADLPAQVRFILTSRREPRVLNALGGSTLDIIDDAPPSMKDVNDYIHSRLKALEEPKRTEAGEYISKSAKGNFLYSRYVLDDLIPNIGSLHEITSIKLPKELNDIYRTFIKRELGRVSERWEESFRPFLGILAVARGEGLTTHQLINVTGLSQSKIDSLLSACSQYLNASGADGRFRIYHQSFRDFLHKSEEYNIYPSEANRAISTHFLSKYQNNWLSCEDKYALHHTLSHLLYAIVGIQNENDLEKLKHDAVSLLSDIAFLESKAAIFGIQPVVSDISSAASAFRKDKEYRALMHELLLLITSEAHNLFDWNKAKEPAFFAQQIYNRAITMGLNDFSDSIEHHLEKLSKPYFRLNWLASSVSSSLELVLTGHKHFVNHVAVTLDSKHVISESDDETVRIWDLNTGKEIRRLDGSINAKAIAVTADNRQIITATDASEEDELVRDETIIIWDLNTGKQMRRLHAHKREARAVVVTPDNKYAITAGVQGITIWELDRWKEKYKINEHAIALCVVSNSLRFVSASYHELKVRELATGKEVKTLKVKKKISVMTITPDGRYVIYGILGPALEIWDLHSRNSVRKIKIKHEDWERSLEGEKKAVKSIQVTPDSKYVVAATTYPTIRMWNLESLKEVQSFVGHELGSGTNLSVNSLAITIDGRRLISGASDNRIIVWNLSTKKPQHRHGHHTRMIDVSIASDGKHGLSGSEIGEIKEWDLASGKELSKIILPTKSNLDSLALVADRKIAVQASDTISIWDLEEVKEIERLPCKIGGRSRGWGIDGHMRASNYVDVNSNGQIITTAYYPTDASIIGIWNFQTGELVSEVETGYLPLVATIPGTRHILTVSKQRLQLFDLSSGKYIKDFGRCDASIIDTSPDGKSVAIWSKLGIIQIRRIADNVGRSQILGKHEHNKDNHVFGKAIEKIAFSTSGRYLVSASSSPFERTIKVWDLKKFEERITFENQGEPIFVNNGYLTLHCIAFPSMRSLKLYDIERNKELPLIEVGNVHQVGVTYDYRYAILKLTNGKTTIWDIQQRKEKQSFIHGEITTFCIPSNHAALLGLENGQIRFLDIEKGKDSLLLKGKSAPIALTMSPDGRYLLAAYTNGKFIVWDMEKDIIHSYLGEKYTDTTIDTRLEGHFTISYPFKSGTFFVESFDLQKAQVVRLAHLRVTTLRSDPSEWDDDRGGLRLIGKTSSDGGHIAYTNSKGIKIQDTSTDKDLELRGYKLSYEEEISALSAIEHDLLISGSSKGRVKISNIRSGKNVSNLVGHHGAVLTCDFIDKEKAVTGSYDRTLRMWYINTGKELARMSLEGAIECITKGPDNKTLLVGDRLGNVYCLRYVESRTK